MFAGRLFISSFFRTQQHENRKLIYIEHCLSLSFFSFFFFSFVLLFLKQWHVRPLVLSFYDDVSHTYTCAFEIVNQETSKIWWFFIFFFTFSLYLFSVFFYFVFIALSFIVHQKNVYFISLLLFSSIHYRFSFFFVRSIFIYIFYNCSLSSFLCTYVQKRTCSVCVSVLVPMEEREKLYLKKEEDEEDELILALFSF